MMRAALIIARRELLERIRSKWFLVMTLLGPIAMVAVIVLPVLLAGREAKNTVVDIVDESGAVAEPLAEELKGHGWQPTVVDGKTSDEAELAKIRRKDINGYFRVSADILTRGSVAYRGDNGSSQFVQGAVQVMVPAVVHRVRGEKLGLDPDKLTQMLGQVLVTSDHTNGESLGANGTAMLIVGFFLGFALYFVITLYGVNVLRSVVQEKTSRVMELLVASVRPSSLMTGKILGVGGAGLIQLSIWLGIGVLVTNYRDALLGHFGLHAAGGVMDAIPPLTAPIIIVALAYFLLGFFFYASLYAAAGACVSSEQDTQQAAMPITLFLILGMVFVQSIAGTPRGETAVVLSQVPFWSPMLMPIRYILGSASTGEVAMSLGILAVSLALVTRIAGKIYRVGVLMYGKRPSVAELLRWLRY